MFVCSFDKLRGQAARAPPRHLGFPSHPISIGEGARNSCERETLDIPILGVTNKTIELRKISKRHCYSPCHGRTGKRLNQDSVDE